MTTLVLAESTHDTTSQNGRGQLLETTKRLVHAAQSFGQPVRLLILDREEGKVAPQAARLEGVEQVYVAHFSEPNLVGFDEIATLAFDLCDKCDVVLAADTGRGKYVLPLLAARLRIAPVTGVSAILADGMIERPVYAGSLIERNQLEGPKKLLTIRTAHFSPVAEQPACPIDPVSPSAPGSHIEILEHKKVETKRPNLADAAIVVSGGRGLGSGKNFAKLESFADQLGAALGASRIAVDMGWAPHILQVGQTGVQIAPDLYIALGISGAVQHIAGIQDAGKIVAINKDADAAIFKVADYGIIGDLHALLPDLQKALVKDS